MTSSILNKRKKENQKAYTEIMCRLCKTSAVVVPNFHLSPFHLQFFLFATSDSSFWRAARYDHYLCALQQLQSKTKLLFYCSHNNYG